MNKSRIHDIGLGLLLGIIIVSIIMLLVPRQTKEPLTATPVTTASPAPEPSTEPAVTPVQFQDDELASDIIRTSSSLDTMMKLVQSRIDEGDLIQQRADQYRIKAVALAKGEPYTKKELIQVQLPFSHEDI